MYIARYAVSEMSSDCATWSSVVSYVQAHR